MTMQKGFFQKYSYYIAISFVFISSRIILNLFYIEFDGSSIASFWQYLDMDLLKNNLMESLFYLHSQPPLFNLYLGVGLKLFPDSYLSFFHVTYMAMSWMIYVLMFKILKTYGFKPYMAFILATIFIISPEAILYENWLFYTWPVAFLLVSATYCLQQYQNTLNFKYALIFLILITIIALTRSSFHLVYIFIPITILFLISKGKRKKIIVYSLIPIILIMGLYTKNLILFDSFGSSSWLGMNIWRVATHPSTVNISARDRIKDPKDKRKVLIQRNIDELQMHNKISQASVIGAFESIDKYPLQYHLLPNQYANIKVLSDKYKTTGAQNFNYYGYINIAKDMKMDAIYLVTNNFPNSIRAVVVSLGLYSRPSWHYSFVAENHKKIKGYSDFFVIVNPRVFLEEHILGIKSDWGFPYSSFMLIPFSMILIVIYILIHMVDINRDKKIDFVSIFMLYTILYMAIVGNIFEIGENNRMRVMTDPLLYMLVIISIKSIYKRLRCN